MPRLGAASTDGGGDLAGDRTFVGLLLLAVFVAIVARPLGFPTPSRLVIAGLLVGIGASAAGVATIIGLA